MLMLAALLWLALVVSIPVLGAHRAYITAALAGALLVAYGVATLLGSLPVSPGGLGIVEGTLVPSLVGFGVPGAAAVLAVVCWRLFEFWLPIPVAGLCYLSLRIQLWRRDGRRDETRGDRGLPALTQAGPRDECEGEPVVSR
jgi:uncharacterized membrane protein YbhN (UPF0104 family)